MMKNIIKKIAVMVMVVCVFMGASITATATATSNTTTTTVNAKMLAKINDLRVSRNLPSLSVDNELVSYAQTRADEITTKFSHTRPDGTEGLDIIPLTRDYAGENLSWHTADCGTDIVVDETFTALVNSPTHLDNMITPEYTKIGIASVEVNGKIYTAYMFSN